MVTIEQEVRRHPFARNVGIVIAAALAAVALATCGAEPAADEAVETETEAEALTGAQCTYFAEGGNVKICHWNTKSRKFEAKTVSTNACKSHITNTCHPKDYVAKYDPSCKGGSCLKPGEPCDSTLKCCSGTCTNGKCPVPACTPGGGTCTLAGADLCCSKVCLVTLAGPVCTNP